MTVILINEECHGHMGVAADYKSAVKYLLRTSWIDENTKFLNDDYDEVPIAEKFGENWKDIIINDWGIDKFNEEFDGHFYLGVEILIKY